MSLSFGYLYSMPSTQKISFSVLHLMGAPLSSVLSAFFLNLNMPWSDKWQPFSMASSRIFRLNMSLPVKYSTAKANSSAGQYLMSILWCRSSLKWQMPMYDWQFLFSTLRGMARWSVRKPFSVNFSTRVVSRCFSYYPSLRVMKTSMSPQVSFCLRYEPHTQISWKSLLPATSNRVSRTTSNIRVTFFLGILISRSSTYFRPIFWFFVSISGLAFTSSLKSSMVLTPLWYISLALAAPMPHTRVICSRAMFSSVFFSCSSLLMEPVFSSSLILSTILSPMCFWVTFSLSTSSSVTSSWSRDLILPMALEYAILRPLSPSLLYTFSSLASSSIINLLLEGLVISFSYAFLGICRPWGSFLSLASYSIFSSFVRFLGFPSSYFRSQLVLSLKLATGTTLAAVMQDSTKEMSRASLQTICLGRASLISLMSSLGSHSRQSALAFLPRSAECRVSRVPPCQRISMDRFSTVRLLRQSVSKMKDREENKAYFFSLAFIVLVCDYGAEGYKR